MYCDRAKRINFQCLARQKSLDRRCTAHGAHALHGRKNQKEQTFPLWSSDARDGDGDGA